MRKGNFLEADELLALIEAASAIDEPVSPRTLGRAELVRRMRGERRTWKEIAAELDVAESTAIWLAGRYRRDGRASPRCAIVATLGCAGLRNTEVCDLDVGDLDFAHGVIHVRDAETEAGIRQVHMTPWLHDELLAYRATRPDAQPDEPAFPTRNGAGRDLRNINRRVITPAVRAANALRAERREAPLPGSIYRPHVPPHVHHPDARGGRAGSLRAGTGRPRGPDDDARDLRAGPQAPGSPTPRRGVRRADGRRGSVGSVDHDAYRLRPLGRPRHAPFADGFRGFWPQKGAKPESVAKGNQLSNDERHENLAICGAFAEPSVGLEPTTPSLPWKVLGFTSVHGRSRAGTKSLQTAAIRTVRLRRPKNGRDETGGRKMDGRHGSAVDPKVVEVLVSGRRVFSLPVPRRRRSGRSTKRARRRVATDDLRVAVAHSVGDQARARRSCR